jgi:type I restriction enzyme, R subunit
VLLERLRDRINTQGTLHVLRHGIDLLGLKGKLELAQFKPALAMNPELTARYKAIRRRQKPPSPQADPT